MFWSDTLAIPKHTICTDGNQHHILVMRDDLQRRSYLEDLDWRQSC